MIGFILMLLVIVGIVGYGQYLVALTFGLPVWIAVFLFILIFSPLLLGMSKAPFQVKKWCETVGYLYIGSNLYLLPLVYLNRIIDFPKWIYLFVAGMVVYGIYNCNHTIIKEYTIPAPFEEKMVLISDVHLGYQIGQKRFQKMIDQINTIGAKYVMIAGDLCDMDLNAVMEQNLLPMLDSINGEVYMCMGNHDNYTRQVPRLKEEIGKTKVRLLDDEVVHLDKFTIIGRNDAEASKRKLDSFEKGSYNIVLDHTPSRIQESIDEKIDLHLSGHTHNGQLFPLQIVTNHIFKVGYGHRIFGKTHVVVSGGIGFWGPMNKSSAPSEIVVLDFKKENV